MIFLFIVWKFIKCQKSGRQVAELFTRYRVWEYVCSCFEALHTTEVSYIVDDIDHYIESRKENVML